MYQCAYFDEPRWEGDAAWFAGTVHSFAEALGEHLICYDDGEQRHEFLDECRCRSPAISCRTFDVTLNDERARVHHLRRRRAPSSCACARRTRITCRRALNDVRSWMLLLDRKI